MATTPAMQAPSGHAAAAPDPKHLAAMRKAAHDFEAVFVGQLLGALTEGLQGEGPLGGGDDPFAGMLRDQYGKLLVDRGGLGIADAVMRQLLRAQEAA